MNRTINRFHLANFGNLELLAKQVVEGFITGLHKSPFHGFSVEFAEHRMYNSGESTRHIDWKLYAKSGKFFTKKYEEETNLRCQIVIDCSSSMLFPKGKEMNKLEFSIYGAASLIELLKKQRDALGLSTFTDKLDLHTEAKSSPAHLRYLFNGLEKHLVDYSEEKRTLTNSIKALNDIAELSHKRSLIVIFSDLLDDPMRSEEFFQALQHMKHNKHEVIVFHVVDKKMEVDFELDNRPYTLVDMETGEKMKLQPAEIKEKYKESIGKYFQELKLKCANLQIDFMPANIQDGFHPILLQYLLKRGKLY
ncbi:MAG: DUF58 domain-containing protein [Flavobacteriia bacterium]|nr:DUF58 domain-containing protein [Flavobacteriia bacterium]